MSVSEKNVSQYGYDDADYNPNIVALVDASEDHWGDPIRNRDGLIPTGIRLIDKAIYGLDPIRGGMYLFMGEKKNRKSTFVRNIIMNYMTADKPVEKPVTVIDILESGENPVSVKDTFISMVASKYLIYKGHAPTGPCPVCEGRESNTCKQLGITPDFLMYMSRTKEQHEAIQYARQVVRTWPIKLFGSHPKQGNTRNLQVAMRRWERLIDEAGAKIFVPDHVQQYSLGVENEYEKQLRAVAEHSDVVAKYGVIDLLLSQVSLTSLREERTGNGARAEAAGGMKAAAEALATFRVRYKSGDERMLISLEEARKASALKGWQPLEPKSGVFYGEFSTDFD